MFNDNWGSGGFIPSMKEHCCRNLTRGIGLDLTESLYGCLLSMDGPGGLTTNIVWKNYKKVREGQGKVREFRLADLVDTLNLRRQKDTICLILAF